MVIRLSPRSFCPGLPPKTGRPYRVSLAGKSARLSTVMYEQGWHMRSEGRWVAFTEVDLVLAHSPVSVP